jgi:hypothetical protein
MGAAPPVWKPIAYFVRETFTLLSNVHQRHSAAVRHKGATQELSDDPPNHADLILE